MTALISTPFGADATAADVLTGVDLTGRRAVVTGGAAGLGLETARALAAAGAQVTIAARRLDVARSAADDLAESTGNPHIDARSLDLADLQSVADFVGGWSGPLHILVDNAGVMATPFQRTAQGHELQFGTNHLGHFALTVGLYGALAAADGARVVVVSSVGHINGGIDFEDIDFHERHYDPWLAYAQSKTANVLFAVEAARRWAADHIAVNALNPGRIWGTGLSRYVDTPPESFDPSAATGVSVKTVEQGAATSVLLAASPLVDGVTGRYFEDCQEAESHQDGVRRGVAAYALDIEDARRLWDLSVGMTARPVRS
ncbi:SDR family NAD(P)-dependent oxidoreductase [Gordonia sp. DT30]|uniref:SDR family NAD(P)-dependent oxidoreductase n=1 Tax=Gordonia sp. DT30 TaxID=3416546 RepID=UPI003CEC24C3